jgi:hypothetical protein
MAVEVIGYVVVFHQGIKNGEINIVEWFRKDNHRQIIK